MSARDEILYHLWCAVPSTDDADARAKAAQMLDAYAHELAEQIRAVGVDEWEGMSDAARRIRQARLAVANLIDPYVEDPA